MLRHRLAGLVAVLALLPAALPSGAAEPVCVKELPPGTPLSCPPPPPPPAPKPLLAPPADRGDLTAYVGLGTWVDVYDWTDAYTNNRPKVTPASLSTMAERGIRTVYLQVAKAGAKNPALLETARLKDFLRTAHAKRIRVVAWYLPVFSDPADDLRHLKAAADFRADRESFDSIGVDIEWRNGVKDHDERSRRLVTLTRDLRQYAPKLPLAAIVMPPVVTDVINKQFWPRFPWKSLKSHYDVWQPMSYWTNRSSSSSWRNAYTYTKANVDYLRRDLGDSKAKVHPAGGIGNASTSTDYSNFVKAAKATASIGGSIYDYATTTSSAYSILRGVPSR